MAGLYRGTAGLYGWTGTVLRVDLSRGEINKEPLNQEWAHS
jgi:aldehyde:ferredoxin oxidoreductase